jgi:hypothetical protein
MLFASLLKLSLTMLVREDNLLLVKFSRALTTTTDMTLTTTNL